MILGKPFTFSTNAGIQVLPRSPHVFVQYQYIVLPTLDLSICSGKLLNIRILFILFQAEVVCCCGAQIGISVVKLHWFGVSLWIDMLLSSAE